MSGYSNPNGNATSIQGVPVSSSAPTATQVLGYNGTDWLPEAAPSNNNATQIQGVAIDATAPNNLDILTYNGTDWTHVPGLTSGGILGDAYYNPAGAVTFTNNSTTPAALDTTNLRATFVAPLDGIVYVRFGCYCLPGAGAINPMLCILDGATIKGVILGAPFGPGYIVGQLKITGLTAGNTYHYDLALASVQAATTVTAKYGGGNVVTTGFGNAFVEVRT